MNIPGDRDRLSDDRSRYAPRWARASDDAEGLDSRFTTSLPHNDRTVIERAHYPRLVNPEILEFDIRPGSITARRARGPFDTLGRFALVASVAVIAPLLMLRMLLTAWTNDAGDRTAEPVSTEPRFIGQTQGAVERQTKLDAEQRSPPRGRLVIRQAPLAGAGDPIPLGVSLAGTSGGASVLVSGLPAGSTISSGRPVGASNWRLRASELSNATILPRRSFVGAIDLAVELRLADDTIADRQSVHLTWIEPPKAPTALAAPRMTAVQAPVSTPTARVEIAATQPRAAANSQGAGTPLRFMNRGEIAYLLNRGEEFIAAGDIGPARLVLQRAAEAGDARAAFALATTYDPILLGTHRARGVAPDVAMARAWYEKAKELGSTDASRRLEMLASRDH